MLDQQPKFKANLSVRDAIENQLVELKSAKLEYEKITNELMTNYEDENLLRRQSDLASFLEFHNAWDLDNMIERVLIEFQLKQYEHKDVNLLRGGEQRRVSLAGLILKKPDVLLLDEPTNHLDMESITALNEALKDFSGALLFTSQDHQFVQTTAYRIMEITPNGLIDKECTYDEYLENDEAARKRQIVEIEEDDE